MFGYDLTHWGWETHICVSKLAIIGSDNGLSPIRRRAIIWVNNAILLIGPLWTNFIHFHSRKCVWKCRPGNGAILSRAQCVNCLGFRKDEMLSWACNILPQICVLFTVKIIWLYMFIFVCGQPSWFPGAARQNTRELRSTTHTYPWLILIITWCRRFPSVQTNILLIKSNLQCESRTIITLQCDVLALVWLFGPANVTFWTCQCDYSALGLFPANGTLPRELK